MTACAELLWVGGDDGGRGSLDVFDVTTPGDPEPVASLELPNPSWGTFSADGRHLHMVGETGTGTVSTVDVAALLAGDVSRAVVSRVASGGAEPCHAALSPDGHRLGVAHFGDGAVVVHRLGHGGSPTGAPSVLQLPGGIAGGPRAHQVHWLADTWLLVPDLGGDALHELALGENGDLRLVGSAPCPSGSGPRSGPRHLARVDEASLLLVEELAGAVSWWTGPGRPTRVGVLDLSRPARPRAEPSGAVSCQGTAGHLVHVAVRGPDVVTTVSWPAEAPPRIVSSVPSGGCWPRDLCAAGDRRRLWVADQRSDVVAGLALDPVTGLPGAVVTTVEVAGPAWVASTPGTRARPAPGPLLERRA